MVTSVTSAIGYIFYLWIAPGNLYWTDQGQDVIEVSRLNGSHRYVVVNGNMDKPKSIAVHPNQG